MQKLQPLISSLQNFAQKKLEFKDPPKLFLKQDQENAKDVFGKTAYYDPSEKSITLFTTGRHPKDILRSFAHELVHHTQNLRGDLSPEKCGEMGMGYAQQNDHMREMEREAYEKGNMCFRDWEDGIKYAIQQENNQLKENKKMVKISKKELKGLIGKILETKLEEKVVKDKEAAAHNKKAEDAKEAEKKEKMEKEKKELEDVLAKKRTLRKEDATEIDTEIVESEELEEAKPDYIDIDGDGDKEESMKKAAADKKSKTESKIQTPEQEQALYESRFNKRNEEVFDKLKKLWTK